MNKFYAAVIGSFLLLCFSGKIFGQQVLVTDAKKKELDAFSAQLNNTYQANRQLALSLAKTHGWAIRRKTKKGGLVSLQGVNSLGFPVYLKTDNNTTAAATTSTNLVQPGGSAELNLSGSNPQLNGKLAIWDGGSVYKLHQEFTAKTITLHDSSGIIEHSTHVAGTMIAKGVYPPAKGMAFGANTLQSYDFDNDVTEMSKAASGLLLSNHSYGDEAGWTYNDLQSRWEWYGLPGDSVDYNFGFYGLRTQSWDKIAYNASYYLIVESAGNSHSETGPAVGADYYGYQSATNQNLVDKGARPSTISSNDAYDVISTTGNAKNILTVGAVNPLPYGVAGSADISIAYFSSWGPTDDGRVKPDIVGDGVDVLSTGIGSTTSYVSLTGTSMSAPNVTGSLYLLQEYYSQKNPGSFMRAATLKGLACHTATDAGNAGPDYIYGWGLLNTAKAAQAITNNGDKSLIKENILQQGQIQTYNVVASGNGPLSVTLSWTDPAGTPTAEGIVNSRIPKLVNDLDIRVSDGTTTFKPWVLDPNHPSAAATTGDNIVDNIEQIYVPGAIPGKPYTVTVSHKGTLLASSQDYSLIATGIGGHSYCASAPLSNADSRVNNVTISNLNFTPPPGCTSYSDHTDLTVQLEQGKTYPFSITLGTCGANFNKAAAIYIDWNGNGVFDANELAAITPVISATGTYTGTIAVPVTVSAGNYSLMRVVLTETSDSTSIKPCGTYAKGETQDYRVQFLQTSTDAGVIAIVSPGATGSCSATTQVTVTLKNFGSKPISNIPVTVTITAPDNTVTTLSQTYPGTLAPLEQEDFTLNGTFNAAPGAAYTISSTTNLPNDVISANNQASQTVLFSAPPEATNLTANYCSDTKTYQLTGIGDGELLWYQNSTDTIPVTYGSPATTTQAPVNNTWYAGLNDFNGSIGPVAKGVFTGGGYNQFTPYVNVTTAIPMVIESARLYVGNAGKITFNVADASGEIVSTSTINAVATRTNPQPGVQPDDPNDQGAVYNLNLLLPGAGNYTITVVYDSTATLYRSNSGVTGYPFKVGNIFSITGNNAVSPTDTAFYKGYYYYFYDIKLKSAGCPSLQRQVVTLIKPVITQNGGILSSNSPTGNQWFLDGNIIAGATGATYTPTQSGNYTVGVTLNGGCMSLSDNFVYVLINNTGNNNDIGLLIYPVPASSQLNIIFAAPASGALNLSIINSAGKIAYANEQTIAAGNFSTVINVSDIAPGTYILKIDVGQKVYSTKIVIGR